MFQVLTNKMNTHSHVLSACMALSCVLAVCMAQGAEYLPPNKGYNYDRPSVPFPTDIAPNKQPTPPPFRAPISRPTNTYIPPNNPPTPHEHDHGDHHHHEPGMPFDFSYAVNEDGNDYSHNAVSDGDITRGEYRVALPDGRTQIVKYTADWKNGFNAQVSYEGEARYPDQPAIPYRSAALANPPGQQYLPPSQGGGYKY